MRMVLYYLTCSLIILCASLCCGPEEDDYNFVNLESEIPNVAVIDGNKTTFAQGDTIFLTVTIPKKIVATGGKSIDIPRDLGAESCRFQLKLGKKGNFENPSIYILSESEVVVEKGDMYFEENGGSEMVCDVLLYDKNYMFRLGVLLKEKGDFILSQYEQTKNVWNFNFYDEKISDNTYTNLFIKSPLTKGNSTLFGFEFRVE
jgi:hypothetical protein